MTSPIKLSVGQLVNDWDFDSPIQQPVAKRESSYLVTNGVHMHLFKAYGALAAKEIQRKGWPGWELYVKVAG